MRQCESYEGAMSYDCACCSENCLFRKGSNPVASTILMTLIIIASAILISLIIKSGWDIKTILEIVFTIAFLLMSYSFAQLAAGQKKGDKQIIAEKTKEVDSLRAENIELLRSLKAIDSVWMASSENLDLLDGLSSPTKGLPVPESEASEKLDEKIKAGL